MNGPPHPRRTPWLRALLAALALAVLPALALAQSPPVAILYPDVREPYRALFLRIVQGIEERLKAPSAQYVVGESDDVAALGAQLRGEQVKVVIALGRLGLLASRKFPSGLPVIMGAVLVAHGPETREFSGITLTPDPEVLFGWLKSLAGQVKRVTVVYNQARDEWVMERARESAKQYGLTLNALPATNIREAAALYRDFFAQIKDGSEALWLTQDDSTLDENALLPAVLKEAWEKNLVVFSNNPEHVKKGALFSLYPDNLGLGHSLAAMAQEQLQDGKSPGILPLKNLLIALNARTAEHLGLRISNQEKRKFNLIFPQP